MLENFTMKINGFLYHYMECMNVEKKNSKIVKLLKVMALFHLEILLYLQIVQRRACNKGPPHCLENYLK